MQLADFYGFRRHIFLERTQRFDDLIPNAKATNLIEKNYYSQHQQHITTRTMRHMKYKTLYETIKITSFVATLEIYNYEELFFIFSTKNLLHSSNLLLN